MQNVAVLESSSGLSSDEMAVTRDSREIASGRSFEVAVDLFVSGVYKIVEAHYNTNPDGTPRTHNRWGVKLTVVKGTRYVRVFVRSEIGREREEIDTESRGSVYAFIDTLTGDILKPASSKAPSKHARGNVFNTTPCEFCGPYGVASLR